MWPAPGAASKVHFKITIITTCNSGSWLPAAPRKGARCSACFCACSLHVRKLPTDGAHFTDEAVSRRVSTITLLSLLSPPACFLACLRKDAAFPAVWPYRLHCPQSTSASSRLFSLCRSSVFTVEYILGFLQAVQHQNLSRQNSSVFLLSYLYTSAML